MNLEPLQAEIAQFSARNGYPASEFNALRCECGCETFTLFSDAEQGGAVAVCTSCELNESIYDSAEFMEDVAQNVCSCDHEVLHIMVGLAMVPDTEEARWVYVGAHCTACDLVGVFVDWEEV